MEKIDLETAAPDVIYLAFLNTTEGRAFQLVQMHSDGNWRIANPLDLRFSASLEAGAIAQLWTLPRPPWPWRNHTQRAARLERRRNIISSRKASLRAGKAAAREKAQDAAWTKTWFEKNYPAEA